MAPVPSELKAAEVQRPVVPVELLVTGEAVEEPVELMTSGDVLVGLEVIR